MIVLVEKDIGCGCVRTTSDGCAPRAHEKVPVCGPMPAMADCFPVAMAYVRWQELDRMYPHELALERGTLYPELDKPFCGMTVTGGRKC